MNIRDQALFWEFDLEKVLLPIGQCDQLMFSGVLGFDLARIIRAGDNLITFRIGMYTIELYNTQAKTLIITIENWLDSIHCSSVYTISKKKDGEYFILVNHKNRNKIENEYVETFTWSDTKGNLKEIIT